MVHLKDEENIQIKRKIQILKNEMAKIDPDSNLSKIAELEKKLQTIFDTNEKLANEVLRLSEKKDIAKKVLDFDCGDIYFKQHKDLELKIVKLRDELNCANEARVYFEAVVDRLLNKIHSKGHCANKMEAEIINYDTCKQGKKNKLEKELKTANEVTTHLESEIQMLIGESIV